MREDLRKLRDEVQALLEYSEALRARAATALLGIEALEQRVRGTAVDFRDAETHAESQSAQLASLGGTPS